MFLNIFLSFYLKKHDMMLFRYTILDSSLCVPTQYYAHIRHRFNIKNKYHE